ncbi:hypothetical protein SAMN05216232_2157 [Virgibacillus subterraneus]|uniref:Uncharacterized protein n=2 Tax=Virgibacillus TaxID=84406 RepID=A0A1H1BZY6_9BACI|nr:MULTISPECIES: hypothetical protein [Virgibacillus]SDQ56946.1 hypothetical protein SAMN05216231_1978 [Virgibacillus salinus]SEQ29361.1 hypothetical protein SAMN05216232_2157 [Virgibacillus subterraneus]
MKLIPIYRINTYVVPESLDRVIEGVLSVDGLIYGNYKNVAWHSNDGIEQFVPSENSVPTEGSIGERKQVTSFKIEFSIPRDKNLLSKVIEEGIYPNHPWDEPVVQVTEEYETRKHG